MRFGIGLSVQHRPEDSQPRRFAEHVEQVRLARQVGFASIWASQHYLSAPFTYFQPIPTLARVAAEAEGMTLGTGVILLPLHHPVELAEQLATLDVITNGHLVVGFGLGYRDAENLALGLDPKDRVGRLVEGLAVIERLWSGEPVDYEGKHFRLHDVRISMPPVQRTAPAHLARGQRRRGVKRAARLADTWLINPHTALPTLERQLALFHAARRDAGRAARRGGAAAHPRVLRGGERGDRLSRRCAPTSSPSTRPIGSGSRKRRCRRRDLELGLRGARPGPLRHRRPCRASVRRSRAIASGWASPP